MAGVGLRPIAALLLAFIVGILLAPTLPLPPLLCSIAALVILIIALQLPERWRPFLLLALVFLGIGRTRAVEIPANDDISGFIGAPSLWVSGRVDSLVEKNPDGGSSFTLATCMVNDFRAVHRVSGRVQVMLRQGREPAVGAILRLRGRIQAIDSTGNPGAFDFQKYFARHGVFCRMVVRYPADLQRAGVGPPSLLTVAQPVRQWVLAQTDRHLSPTDAALLDGILLSSVSRIPPGLSDAFQRTGTVHILSVSGLHMTALAGVLLFLLRGYLPRSLLHPLLIVILGLFALASGGSAAPVRSVIMAAVVLAAPLLRRTAEPLHALAFAALLILFAQPGSLFDAGFQLSFVSVGGLLFLMPPLTERFFPPKEINPRKLSRVARVANAVLLLLVVGVVAQLVTAPLIAYHFNQVSVIAPVANVLIALWSEALLIAGLATVTLGGILGSIAPGHADWLYVPLAYGLAGMRFMAQAFAALPFAAVAAPAPPVIVLLGYYLLVIRGGIALGRHR